MLCIMPGVNVSIVVVFRQCHAAALKEQQHSLQVAGRELSLRTHVYVWASYRLFVNSNLNVCKDMHALSHSPAS